MADWLGNIAKVLTRSEDLTEHLILQYPEITPFSEPPWAAKAANARLQESQEAPLMQAFVAKSVRGEWGVLGDCGVCRKVVRWVQDRQCWGCADWFHGECLGGFQGRAIGPYHCPRCLREFG